MAHILLVDDDPLVAETLSIAMTSKGQTVVTANNGLEGLEKFSEGTFDLVITDLIMPDMEGIGMIMELRRRAPTVKIMAISGGGRTGTGEFLTMAKDLGAMASLQKPIRLSDFYDTLDRCLG